MSIRTVGNCGAFSFSPGAAPPFVVSFLGAFPGRPLGRRCMSNLGENGPSVLPRFKGGRTGFQRTAKFRSSSCPLVSQAERRVAEDEQTSKRPGGQQET